MKKKILLIHHVSTIGGSANQFYFLVKILFNSGKYDLKVALKEPGPISDQIKRLGVKTIFLKQISPYPYCKSFYDVRFYFELFSSIKSYFSIKRVLSKEEFDLIYFNSLLFFYLLPLSKKSILHVRENWYNKLNFIQFNFIKSVIRRKKCSVIYINNTLRDSFNFKTNQSRVIYDFINFKKLEHKKVFKRDGFLFTGGISEIKGLKKILRVFKEIDFKLIILGISKSTKRLHKGFKGKFKHLLYLIGIKFYHDSTLDLIESLGDKCIKKEFSQNISKYYSSSLCTISYTSFPHALLSIPEALYLDCSVICREDDFAKEYCFGSKKIIMIKRLSYLKNHLNTYNYWDEKTELDIKSNIYNKFSFKKNYIKILIAVDETFNEINNI